MGIDYGVYVFSRWREEATYQDDKILALKKA
jgi:predicted RND superfamily exporter protein